MEWYLKVIKQYADFNGRARRKEYWMFILFNMIFSIVAMIVDNVLGITFAGIPYGPLYIFYGIAMFIPGLAVSVRRLHDINKSGWMMFVVLIPFAGAIWLLVLYCTEGTQGENQYGDNPKNEEGFLKRA